MYHQFRAQAVPDFMQREAPPNYIAGLGRGATGFTTSSDLGGIGDSITADPETEGDRPLFDKAPYEADDEEADRVWEEIETKMDERRRKRRELREQEQLEKMRKEKPKIQQQFSDLKRDLTQMSYDDWSSLPEVGDLTRKKGKKQKSNDERFSAVPDSVVLGAMGAGMSNTIVDASDGTTTNFAQFGEARKAVLGVKLDQVSDSVSGQTTIDPKGYLSGISSSIVKSDTEISDIKKARTLLKSVISSNPKHAPGWIAAARLEEVANALGKARELIAQGCVECPKNEDVWLEAARLNSPEDAKIILANAVREIPQSIKIWLKASDLETEHRARKRVLRRALEYVPNSVKLWKAAVSAEEDPNDARILLSKAVECIPLSIDLWLALARLEDYSEAKKVLNKARAAIPTSHEIWLAAAKLEEQNTDGARVTMIVTRAIQQLAAKGCTLSKEEWIKEAESSEKEGFLKVCKAIITSTISTDVIPDDLKHSLLDDAEQCASSGSIETARAIYEYAIEKFSDKKSVWRKAAFFEKEHGTQETLENLLERAVQAVPHCEVLWLLWAKEKWMVGDVPGAKAVLERAFSSNPESEQIWLAAVKLENETGNVDSARSLLAQAREMADTERVWMKSAVIERQVGNFEKALDLLDLSIRKFPGFAKLWIIKLQILADDLKDADQARETYTKALKHHPKSATLWILASRFEEKNSSAIKARATLEKARVLNQADPDLWLESIRVEARAGNTAMAKALLAKSLQTCPASGKLWSQAIIMENRPQRKARSADALKKCENDATVVMTIARLFWAERKLDKARNWFERASKTDPDQGDAWAWWLSFEKLHGTPAQRQVVIDGCTHAEPKHGEEWQQVSKNMSKVGKSSKEILELVAARLENNL